MRDTLFADPGTPVRDFAFNKEVTRVFDDMIRRSVPGYGTIIEQIGVFSRRFVRDHTTVYDLGCSLGAGTMAVREALSVSGCQIVAVDSSAEMISEMSSRFEGSDEKMPVRGIVQDVRETRVENASMILLNFTLQFIDHEHKEALLRTIWNGLLPGGALILSEKIQFDDPEEQRLMEELHIDFKRFNGYADLEISRKRDALENVLKLDSEAEHLQRLRRVGFRTSVEWFRYLNFISCIAIK